MSKEGAWSDLAGYGFFYDRYIYIWCASERSEWRK